jgi:hypothetical protein
MTRSRNPARTQVCHEAPTAFVLVAHGSSVPTSEVEAGDEDALEVRIFWDHSHLATHHLGPFGSLVIGDHEDSIARIPESALGSPAIELARATDAGYLVRVPPGALARVGGGVRAMEVEGPREYETCRGDAIRMKLGNFHLEIAHGRAGRAVPRPTIAERVRDGATLQVAGAALLHTALIGVFAFHVPALAGEEAAGLDGRDKVALMRHYLSAAAEREKDESDADRATAGAAGEDATSGGARAAGSEGKMGRDGAPAADRRWGKLGPKDNANPSLGRDGAVLPKGFELIGLVAENQGDPHAPAAPWGRLDALGADSWSALGNMWARTIGEAGGAGGLGLTGTGEGGGSDARWVGLDMDGFADRLGHGFGPPGDGGGIGRGGRCPGCQAPGHAVRGPSLRPAGETTISGHIPADVIQRVVRDNFGRFRGCYEAGLRQNPGLEGRVVTRFVIDRQGVVTAAQDGGSSLTSPSVVACVVRSFYSLTFPEHDGGVVTVVYPLALRPE